MEKTAIQILDNHFHYFSSERTRELVIKCMEEYASQFKQPAQTDETQWAYNNRVSFPVSDEAEFLRYCKESREQFCRFIAALEFSTPLRTEVDNLLICFDQMKERLTPPNK